MEAADGLKESLDKTWRPFLGSSVRTLLAGNAPNKNGRSYLKVAVKEALDKFLFDDRTPLQKLVEGVFPEDVPPAPRTPCFSYHRVVEAKDVGDGSIELKVQFSARHAGIFPSEGDPISIEFDLKPEDMKP